MVTNAQAAHPENGTSTWWPSKYGPDDQAGALNEITPGKVLEAIRLVRQGRVYDLAHVLDQDIPAFPGRTFRQYLTTNYHQINRRQPDAGPAGLGTNSVNWIEDHGTNRLGIDTLPQVVTRGLLLDVAASRGGERLKPGDVITVADAEAALAAAGLDVRPGDAVFFHTGWGELWGNDNERYASGEPGPGTALGEWLAERRVALTGDYVYRYDPAAGRLSVVADGFDKPNGLAFSPDERTLYITDSGANQEPGSYHVQRPHHIVASDVRDGSHLGAGRLFAVTTPGFPDGIKVDRAGRVYASSLSGVQVFSPAGDPVGLIRVPGAVNFTFGGPAGEVLFITTDTAIWAAVFNPAAGAGQRHDQEPGRW